MLVLSRHKEESIMVGDDVEIQIVGIRPNEIRLGIKAPKTVPVYRKEVYERICREKEVDSVGYPHFYARQSNTVAVNT
ncbi:MAG: carbon storage regulator CsrA [Sedimentisphaerales bacterium]